MSKLETKNILDLPDEIIDEYLMPHLEYKDLCSLVKVGNRRLKNCSDRCLRNIFFVAVIGGSVQRIDSSRIGLSRKRKMRRREITTNAIEVLQLRQKLLTGIDWHIPNLPELLLGATFQVARISNGKLLLCGGHKGIVIDKYEPKTFNQYLTWGKGEPTWSSMGNMLLPRSSHSSVFMNGSIFTCGGWNEDQFLEHHEEFRLGDKTVIERKPLPIKLEYHSAKEIDQNRYMVMGGLGQIAGNCEYHSTKTFIYNTETDEWISGPQMLEGRHFHSSCVLKSREGIINTIVIVGGCTKSSLFSSSTELFSIKENRWSRGPDLPIVVRSASCVALPHHPIYSCLLIGGRSKEGKEEYISDSIYALDNDLKRWTLVGHLKEPRCAHTVTLIE